PRSRVESRRRPPAGPLGGVRPTGSERRLLAADRRADPEPGRSGRSGRRRAAPARRRGELMVVAANGAANGTAAPSTPTPTVVFGAGRRPESSTQVRLESFDGPLALLLALIEARQLDVVTVPLGALADAYLDALAGLDGDRLANVSAFVSVASQLILIKSRAILPRHEDAAPTGLPDDGPDPEAELRARLLLYRAHRDAGRLLQERAIERWGLFRREPAVAGAAGLAGARPPEGPPMDPAVLRTSLDRLAVIVAPPEPPPEVVPRTITLTARAEIIRAAIRGAGSAGLQDLLPGVPARGVTAGP